MALAECVGYKKFCIENPTCVLYKHVPSFNWRPLPSSGREVAILKYIVTLFL